MTSVAIPLVGSISKLFLNSFCHCKVIGLNNLLKHVENNIRKASLE